MSSELIMIIASSIIAIIIILIYLFGKNFIKEKRIVTKLDTKSSIQMIISTILVVLAISYLNPNSIGNIVMYFVMLFLMPYVYLSNQKRKKDEYQFNEIILLCNNVATLLKQNHNAYLSLSTAQNEINGELKKDVDELLRVLQEDKRESANVYNQFAEKYNYTIIKEFNVLILQIYYENNSNIDKMIDLFQEDVEKLLLDVKENQVKRKMIRIQYIALSIGCIGGEWYLIDQLSGSLRKSSTLYGNISFIYSAVVLICLFFVDQYFNNHITKE